MAPLKKLEELIYHGFRETDQKIQETSEQIKQTDRQLKETDRQLKETDHKLRQLVVQVSDLTGSIGRFAENMVAPAAERLFAQRGIHLTGFDWRALRRRNGSAMEVDILGVGAQHVIAIEVKFRLELRDVQDFLTTLPHFFDFFDSYRGRILYGAIAGMSINEGVDRFAYKNGLFVLAQSGENMRLLNDGKFIPRAYEHQQKTKKRKIGQRG